MDFRTITLCETIELFVLFLYLVNNSKNMISRSTKLAIIARPYLLNVFQ